jgi:hypothetical protein
MGVQLPLLLASCCIAPESPPAGLKRRLGGTDSIPKTECEDAQGEEEGEAPRDEVHE